MKRSLPMLVATLGLTAACGQMAQEPPRSIVGVDTSRQCFFVDQVNGYGSAPDGPNGEERLIVSTGPRDDWLFESRGPCNDLDFAHQIAFDTRGRSTICTGDIETLLVPSTIPDRMDRCQVRMLGKMLDEPEEADAEG